MSELNNETMEVEVIETEEAKDGNLGLVLGLGALGGLAIGAATNGIIKGVKALKAKRAEKKADKPKKEKKTPFWKKKAKEETHEEQPAEEKAEEA